MPKKFYDIVPPRLVKKSGTKSKAAKSAAGKNAAARFSKKSGKEGMPARSKAILISACVVVVIVLAYLYVKLPYLSVDIQPTTTALVVNQQITADKSLTAIDLQAGKIPAKIIEADKELWQDFPSTGSSSNQGYSTGTITVYNKYTPATSLSLRAKTRFISDSGKYFLSVGKISIPAAKVVNGKVTPGSVDVKVIAIESGADYNIGASNFAIPGLVGTAFYSSLYGVSQASMSGGFASNSKLVTSSDIADAKSALSKKVLDIAVQSLKDESTAEGLVLFDNAVTKSITEDTPSVKAGAQVDTFNYKMKAHAQALVFSESDLKEYTRQYALSQVPGGQTILAKSFKLEYAPINVDLKADTVSLQLKISASTYPKVDDNTIAASLQGKNSDQINDVIYNDFNQQVSGLKINFWPFWVSTGPENPDRIKVNLIFP